MMKYYFYTFKNPTGRRASVREFITRQTCKICDYKVDYMCPKLGVLIDGDFKFGVLLLVFVRFLGGGDIGNLYRNDFL